VIVAMPAVRMKMAGNTVVDMIAARNRLVVQPGPWAWPASNSYRGRISLSVMMSTRPPHLADPRSLIDLLPKTSVGKLGKNGLAPEGLRIATCVSRASLWEGHEDKLEKERAYDDVSCAHPRHAIRDQ
jgi:hypothetical protein